jgi:hypothetical protein
MELSKRTAAWLLKLEKTMLHREALMLIDGNSVEVGYRSTCGCSDQTMKDFDVFRKFLKSLKSQGVNVNEERVKHGNAYATNNGGFWNSYIFEVSK